jgi:hypothetical protein
MLPASAPVTKRDFSRIRPRSLSISRSVVRARAMSMSSPSSLGGEGAGDVDELAELVAVAVQPLAAAFAARLHVHELESLVEGDDELFVRRLGRKKSREADVQHLAEIRIARTTEEHEARLDARELFRPGAEELALLVPDARRRDDDLEGLAPDDEQERMSTDHRVAGFGRTGGEIARDAIDRGERRLGCWAQDARHGAVGGERHDFSPRFGGRSRSS